MGDDNKAPMGSYVAPKGDPGAGAVPIASFPGPVQDALRELDVHSDGTVRAADVMGAVLAYKDAKSPKPRVSMLVAVLVTMVIVLLLGNFGLSIAVMHIIKDTEVNGDTLTDVHGVPLRTASTDFHVERAAAAGAGPGLMDNASNEMVTVKALPEEVTVALDYGMAIEELREMRDLHFSGGPDIAVQTQVTGFFRNATVLVVKTVRVRCPVVRLGRPGVDGRGSAPSRPPLTKP